MIALNLFIYLFQQGWWTFHIKKKNKTSAIKSTEIFIKIYKSSHEKKIKFAYVFFSLICLYIFLYPLPGIKIDVVYQIICVDIEISIKKNIHGIFYSVCPWGKAKY